eukprot:1900407-Prymnesium_polylepis.1
MSDTEDAPWKLIDCFCGGGLASFGFRAAGMCVVSAVDNSAEALGLYKLILNFQTHVSCATLGPGLSEYTFPEPRPRLHAHFF